MNKQSLHENHIYKIVELAGQGLWLGTNKGLSFFNFHDETFTSYQHIHENLNIPVISLKLMTSGDLAIGTENGLYIYSAVRNSAGRFEGSVKKILDGVVNGIELYKDLMWVATKECVYSYDEKSNKLQDICDEEFLQYIDNERITTLEVKFDNIWIGTISGLIRYDITKDNFEKYTHQKDNPNSLTADWVQTMDFDSNGNLWIGTIDGLTVYNFYDDTFFQYKRKTFNIEGLVSNDILSLFVDNNNLIWLGTYGSGLDIFNTEETLFKRLISKSDVATYNISNSIFSMVKDQEDFLWLTTYGGNIIKLDMMTGNISRPVIDILGESYADTDFSQALNIDTQNRLWIGTNKGINIIDLNTESEVSLKLYRNEIPVDFRDMVETIYFDHSNQLWIGTMEGGAFQLTPIISLQNELSYEIKNLNPELPYIYRDLPLQIKSILETRDGNLWFGSLNGLLMYSKAQEKWFHFENQPNNPQSISNSEILTIFEDSRGILWVGTSNGLNKVNRDNEEEIYFDRITKEDGLPNNVIYSILEDEAKQLWLSTNLGIVKFSSFTETMKSFRANDGLSSDEFNLFSSYIDEYGILYFGSINGVTVIDPTVKRKSAQGRKLMLTNVVVGNNNINVYPLNESDLPELIKTQDDAVIKISVANLYYRSLNLPQYRYRVLGLDDNWIYLNKDRTITFAGLQEGEYFIDVQSRVGDSPWSEASLRIKLNVHFDFFYSRSFVYLVLLLIMCIFLTAIYWVRKYYENKIHRYQGLVKVEGIRLKEAKKQNSALKVELENKLDEIGLMSAQISDTALKLQSHQFRDGLSGFYRYQNIARMLGNHKEENIKINLILIFHLSDLKVIEQELGKIAGAEIISHIAIQLRQKCPSNVHICALDDESFIILGYSTRDNQLVETLTNLRKKLLYSKIPVANDRRVQININITYLEIYEDEIKNIVLLNNIADAVIYIHQHESDKSLSNIIRIELAQMVDTLQDVDMTNQIEHFVENHIISINHIE
ncbi:ligand-binding sensor domain-containing protein [Aliikangiella maris]|uniref:ligand-binding sensor domain-containing protein n=1 Tax=Aliikangiella maris TaxID=3162458 RepID=UPI003459C58F